MENENINPQPSEKPEKETEKDVSDHINPIHLKYLREAWKELKEEKGEAPTNEEVVKRAARNELENTKFTIKELYETEAQIKITLAKAIAKKERDKKAQKDTHISTTISEEPPTEFWEDFPEKIPEKQKKVEDDKPRDWYRRWEDETEARRDELSSILARKTEENKRPEHNS